MQPPLLGTGQTAHLTVTVTPVSGFLGAVALSCSNLPNESACTFGEATLPVGGGSTTLDLSTILFKPAQNAGFDLYNTKKQDHELELSAGLPSSQIIELT